MAAGKSSKISSSQAGLLSKIYGSRNLKTFACKGGKTTFGMEGEDPLVWIGRVDDAAKMLACLDVHKIEVMLRRHIVRHLTNDYDIERRALLRRRDVPRGELEEILRDQFEERQAAKPMRRQNALFAGAQGRGGQGA